MISPETVADVLDTMLDSSVEDAQALVTEMSGEQPLVLAFLMAESEDDSFDEDEGQAFFFVGMVICQIMKQSPHARTITEEELEAAEKANEDLLEKMASDSPGDLLSATESMVENYPEPEVLRYVTHALMEDDDGNPDNPPIREENLGLAFLDLKIVLDAFVGI